jgi:hypothetical protein
MRNQVILVVSLLLVISAQSQTSEVILIGDSNIKAKKHIKNLANLDIDFAYEEYYGWYDGIDDIVNQNALWSSDNMLFMNVFSVDDKVVLIMALSSLPDANSTQAELDQMKKMLRGKDSPTDIIYLRNDTYKVLMNDKFYCYRKHLILFRPNGDRIISYIFDAYNFDALQRFCKLFTNDPKQRLQIRFL